MRSSGRQITMSHFKVCQHANLFNKINLNFFKILASFRSENFMQTRLNLRQTILLISLISVLILILSSSHQDKSEKIPAYGSFLNARVVLENGRNIFFLDTGTATEKVILGSRKACAIESAALANPNSKIFLLFSSHERFLNLENSEAFQAIWQYSHVFINHVDIAQLSVGTPMEKFIASRKLSGSHFKAEHTADALRLILLWKYGGTYLNSHLIVRQQINTNLNNFACLESRDTISTSILNFDRTRGKHFLGIIMKMFCDDYSELSRLHNGPKLLTLFVKGICEVDSISGSTNNDCGGFHVVDEKLCVPLTSIESENYFNEYETHHVLKKINNSIIADFGRQVKQAKSSSKSPYWHLAKTFCPKVFAACENDL